MSVKEITFQIIKNYLSPQTLACMGNSVCENVSKQMGHCPSSYKMAKGQLIKYYTIKSQLKHNWIFPNSNQVICLIVHFKYFGHQVFCKI